jgi:hypothetical protein
VDKLNIKRKIEPLANEELPKEDSSLSIYKNYDQVQDAKKIIVA